MPATDTPDKPSISKNKTTPIAEATAGKVVNTSTAAKEIPIKEQSPSSTEVSSPSSSTKGNSDATLLKQRNMTGKKITSKERPDDNARQLASTLTLEEQV